MGANKGSPGIDGRTVEEVQDYYRQNWPTLEAQLLAGAYQPQPVLRVEIPKPEGGVRKLGIPTALDRVIQQAVLQVLQERFDSTFSQCPAQCLLALARTPDVGGPASRLTSRTAVYGPVRTVV